MNDHRPGHPDNGARCDRNQTERQTAKSREGSSLISAGGRVRRELPSCYNCRHVVHAVQPLYCPTMPERQKTLAEIQEECRRFAAETGDPEASRILRRAADDLERHERQIATRH